MEVLRMRKTFAYVTSRNGKPLKVFTKTVGGKKPLVQAMAYARYHKRKTGKKVYPHWNFR
jgi:hypothetical protein